MVASGCTTIQGPGVDRQAINEETKRLEAKSIEYNIGLLSKVNRIGYRLVNAIPEEEIKVKPRHDIGLFVLPRNKATNRYFGKKPKRGMYIAFVLDGTSMARSLRDRSRCRTPPQNCRRASSSRPATLIQQRS